MTSIISQMIVLVGKQDVVPVEAIGPAVEGIFQVTAIGAVLVSEWKRRRSKIQPLTLTKVAAEQHAATVANVIADTPKDLR